MLDIGFSVDRKSGEPTPTRLEWVSRLNGEWDTNTD